MLHHYIEYSCCFCLKTLQNSLSHIYREPRLSFPENPHCQAKFSCPPSTGSSHIDKIFKYCPHPSIFSIFSLNALPPTSFTLICSTISLFSRFFHLKAKHSALPLNTFNQFFPSLSISSSLCFLYHSHFFHFCTLVPYISVPVSDLQPKLVKLNFFFFKNHSLNLSVSSFTPLLISLSLINFIP